MAFGIRRLLLGCVSLTLVASVADAQTEQLDEEGLPLTQMGILEAPRQGSESVRVMQGSKCPECGNLTVIHRDGCEFCTACGFVGQCG